MRNETITIVQQAMQQKDAHMSWWTIVRREVRPWLWKR